LFFAGLFSGLAILTKGPAGFLILLLCYGVYLVLKKFKIYVSIPHFILYTGITLLVAMVWFGLETIINGPWFVYEFIEYNFRLAKTEDAGHGGFPGYHFVIVFLGCFPASLFSLRAFKKLDYEFNFQKDFKVWMMILLWVILILFSIVQSKIVHYSSMAYFPVTYLAAVVIHQLIVGKLKFQPWIGNVIKASALVIGALMVIVPYLGVHPELLRPLTNDPFVLGNLDAEAGWTGFETLTGFLLIAIAFISISLIRKRQFLVGLIVLFGGTGLTIKLANILFAKNIEAYTERAAIEFFESVQEEDAYLHPVGFKTYIHYFYGRVMPAQKPDVEDWTNQQEKQAWQEWLMFGDIDRPVYFVTKVNKTYRFKEVPQLDSLYAKNGFVFYKRTPPK
jgi:4-amino-4-deoxy-L-arabinose transferase-like glycosyltransferase